MCQGVGHMAGGMDYTFGNNRVMCICGSACSMWYGCGNVVRAKAYSNLLALLDLLKYFYIFIFDISHQAANKSDFCNSITRLMNQHHLWQLVYGMAPRKHTQLPYTPPPTDNTINNPPNLEHS